MKTLQLLVGLGNPGPEYASTRHNAGQDFVEAFARQHRVTLNSEPKFFAFSARLTLEGSELRLLIPTTFMNLSGKAVAAFARFYKIAAENILVVHDELDLAPGIARLKFGGGHGGHNGLRDITSALGNNGNFGRLRIGIGHPGHAKLVSNYVLKKASPDDQQKIDTAIDTSLRHVPELVRGEWEKAMRELHTELK